MVVVDGVYVVVVDGDSDDNMSGVVVVVVDGVDVVVVDGVFVDETMSGVVVVVVDGVDVVVVVVVDDDGHDNMSGVNCHGGG